MGETLSPEVLKLLSLYPWADTLERLTLYAVRKMDRLKWRNSWKGNPPNGIQAEDIVQDVVLKTIEGTRKWDQNKHPDLYLWLQNQIDSEISNLVRSSWNKKYVSESTLSDPAIIEGVDTNTPESILLNTEEESECDSFFLGLLDFLKDEPILCKIVEAFIGSVEQTQKRSDFAQYLGITTAELDAYKKKLLRRVKEFKEKDTDRTTMKKGRGDL